MMNNRFLFVLFTVSVFAVHLWAREGEDPSHRVHRVLVVRAKIWGTSYGEANGTADRHAKAMMNRSHIVGERRFWPDRIINRDARPPDKDGWVIVRYTVEGKDYPVNEIAHSWWDFE